MLLTNLSESVSGILQFITIVIIFILVLAITYIVTRWMANYQKGNTSGANIEVIETHKVTPTKFIQIIRVGEKYLVIAIGKDEITFLSEVKEEEIHLPVRTNEPIPDFSAILDKIKNRKK